MTIKKYRYLHKEQQLSLVEDYRMIDEAKEAVNKYLQEANH